MGLTTESNPQLQVDIKKRLKGFELNLAFEAGRGCLGILGASGCGKSMTLKSIAGIVTPDQGRIALQYSQGEAAGGRVFYDSSLRIRLKPQKRRVGYLFQNYALFPNMTVEENIAVGIKGRPFYRRGDLGAKMARLLEQFRLAGLEKRYPGQLSGGQQQRVALARLMAYEPEALLLDEPFSAMDSYLREGLRLELSRVMEEYGGVAVLVTHDRDEAYQLCQRLLLMDKGRVLAFGKTREVFQNPGTCQAARLTGCKNISRIEKAGPCRVRALDWGGLELDTGRPVEDSVTAVGIRAHDFEPLSEGEAARWRGLPGGNLIPVAGPSVSEMPFEWYITLKNGLWWKIEKDIRTHEAAGILPDCLRIAPEALLLLSGEI